MRGKVYTVIYRDIPRPCPLIKPLEGNVSALTIANPTGISIFIARTLLLVQMSRDITQIFSE